MNSVPVSSAGGAPLAARAAGGRSPTDTPKHQVGEGDFQRNVVDLAHHFGWRAAHFGIGWTAKGYRTPVRYDGAGFPDLVLVHPERGLVWFRELKAGKRPNRPLDPDQQAWYDALAAAGANVAVWRSTDWPDIVAALSNGRAQVS